MCRSDMDDISYLQHRFTQSYQAYTSREEFTYPRVLLGDRAPDSLYFKRGLNPPSPTFIGDRVKAEKVYAVGGPSKERELSQMETLMLGSI